MSDPQRLSVEIPKTMRTLERDKRGYPIPFIVFRDKTGVPQFTINDTNAVSTCVQKRICAICGKKLTHQQYWLVGGSRCFMHEHGAFLDPPLHQECAEYALQVCPFLAAPSYAKRIDDKKLKPENRPDGMILVKHGNMLPDQPERFGLGMTSSMEIISKRAGYLFIPKKWEYVEFWKSGKPCNSPDEMPSDQPISLGVIL